MRGGRYNYLVRRSHEFTGSPRDKRDFWTTKVPIIKRTNTRYDLRDMKSANLERGYSKRR